MDQKAINLNKQVYKIIYGSLPGDQLIDLFGQASTIQTAANTGGGKNQLHSLYPNEFEVYAAAFELISSDSTPVEFFSFPIMPVSMEENKPTNSSIKKTHSGVVINSNPTFKPFDITISGDFGGRLFKQSPNKFSGDLSTSETLPDDVNSIGSTTITAKATNIFSSDYKNGYGCTKKLESIIERAKLQDGNSQPYRLIFYNLAFNSNYLVEPSQLRIYQNKQKNMVWSYSLNMKAIAPVEAVLTHDQIKTSLSTILKFSNLNKGIDDQGKNIAKLLDPTGQYATKLENILNSQLNSRVQSGLNNSQKSAFQAIKELTGSPNDTDNFIVNNTQNILTTRF